MLNHLNQLKLNYYIRELGLSPQATIELHHDLLRLKFNLQREREILKREITNDVLKQISVQVNSTDAVKEIDSLQQAIEKLKGGN
ncbi:MAG: hypothetical protein IKW59_04360 [Clostridia bacterium]|nr:hypothetical protein [Clostridia bacterium]